jgi:hypothetical protein
MSSVIRTCTLGRRSRTLGNAGHDGFASAIAAFVVNAHARLAKTLLRQTTPHRGSEENNLGKTTKREIEYSRAPRLQTSDIASTVIALYTTTGDDRAVTPPPPPPRLISSAGVSDPRFRPGIPDPRASSSLLQSTDGSPWRPV